MSGEDEREEMNSSPIPDEEPQPQLSGWADAMSRILGSNKPKKKKHSILSRAKKDYEVKKSTYEKETNNFEVVVADKKNTRKREVEVVVEEEGGVQDEEKVEEKPSVKKIKKSKANSTGKTKKEDDEDVSLKAKHRHELHNKRMRKEWENLNRTKPDSAKDRETERELMKIASKGVVELFNAVELQKKKLGTKLRNSNNKSEFKRDKILSETKDLFEDALEKVSKKK